MLQSRFSLLAFTGALVVASGVLSQSRAALLENSIGAPTGAFNLTGGSMVYEEFNAGHAAPQHLLADLDVELITANVSGSLVLTLWSDTGSNAPATQLGTIGSYSLASLSTVLGNSIGVLAISNAQYTPGASSLTNNANYWIGFSLVGAPTHGTTASLELSGLASNGTAYPTGSSAGTITSGSFVEMCADSAGECSAVSYVSAVTPFGPLTVDHAQAPEPATLAVLGSALTGLGLFRRRRAKSRQKDA